MHFDLNMARFLFGTKCNLTSLHAGHSNSPFQNRILPNISTCGFGGEGGISPFLMFLHLRRRFVTPVFYVVILITVVITPWLADQQRVLYPESLRGHFFVQLVEDFLSATIFLSFFLFLSLFLFTQKLDFRFSFNFNFLWAVQLRYTILLPAMSKLLNRLFL